MPHASRPQNGSAPAVPTSAHQVRLCQRRVLPPTAIGMNGRTLWTTVPSRYSTSVPARVVITTAGIQPSRPPLPIASACVSSSSSGAAVDKASTPGIGRRVTPALAAFLSFFRFDFSADPLEGYDFEEHGERARLLLSADGVEKLIDDPSGGSRVELSGKSGVTDTQGGCSTLS